MTVAKSVMFEVYVCMYDVCYVCVMFEIGNKYKNYSKRMYCTTQYNEHYRIKYIQRTNSSKIVIVNGTVQNIFYIV